METTLTPVEFTPLRRGGIMFGPRLRQLREERKETLEQAARGIGIYGSTLYRLEAGLRGAGHAIADAIARYYDVPLEELLAS